VICDVPFAGCAACDVPNGLALPYRLELHHWAAWLGAFPPGAKRKGSEQKSAIMRFTAKSGGE
jgi:hypothetical protein